MHRYRRQGTLNAHCTGTEDRGHLMHRYRRQGTLKAQVQKTGAPNANVQRTGDT